MIHRILYNLTKRIDNFFYKFVAFVSSLINIVIFGIFLIITKILLLFKKHHLIKQLWLFSSRFLLKKEIYNKLVLIIINCCKIIYLISLVGFLTCLFYIFINVPFSLLNIQFFLTSNRALLICFIYILLTLFFVKDSFLERIFELTQFNHKKELDYKYQSWNEFPHEYLVPVELSDDISEYEQEEDLANYINKHGTFDNYLSYIEIIKGVDSDLYLYLTRSKTYLNDIYLFERWANLSNQVFDRFHFTRILLKYKNNRSVRNELLLFKSNQSSILSNDFNIYSKLYNFKSNIKIIKNSAQLKKFLINSFLIDAQLSDNLIYNFFYYKLKLDKPREHIFRKDIPSFWGEREQNRFDFRVTSLLQNKLVQSKRLSKNTLISNYDEFIFGTRIFKFYSTNQRFINFSHITGFNFNFILLREELIYSKQSITKKYFIKFSQSKKKFLVVNSLNKETFFFKSVISRKLKFSDEFIYNLVTNILNIKQVDQWVWLKDTFFIALFNLLFEKVLDGLLRQLQAPSINNKLLSKYLNLLFINLFKLMHNKDLNSLLAFEKRYFKVLYQILKFMKLTVGNQTQYFLSYQKLINQFYKTLLPEQYAYIPSKTDSFFLVEDHYLLDYTSLPLLFPKKNTSHFLIKTKIRNFKHRSRRRRLFHIPYFLFRNPNPEDRFFKYFGNPHRAALRFMRADANNLNKFKPILPLNHYKVLNKKLKQDYYRFRYRNHLTNKLKLFFKFEDFAYWLFYGLPSLFDDQKLNQLIKVKTKLKLKYLINDDYKFLHQRLNNDLFYFPYLTSFHKVPKGKNLFLNFLLEQNRYLVDNNPKQEVNQLIFNYKLLKKFNVFNLKNLGFEFLILFEFANRLINIEKDFFQTNYKYTLAIYKTAFIKNILSNKVSFRIKNFNSFKYCLSNYFSTFFFDVFFIKNFKKKLFIDLNLYDFEILTTLGNKYWLTASYGPIKLYNMKKYMKKSFTSAATGYNFVDYGTDVFEKTALDYRFSYYMINNQHLLHIFLYIEKLMKNTFNTNQIDVLEDYIYFFHFIFFFWILSRYQHLFNAEINDLSENLEELSYYEDYTDAFKNYLLEYTSVPYVNDLYGETYLGTTRGFFENVFVSVPYRVPLEESYFDEHVYVGNKRDKKTLYFSNSEEYTKLYYFLEEVRFNVDESENLLTDFFRNDPKFSERQINNLLKWNFYSGLIDKHSFLDKASLINLKLRSKYRTNIKEFLKDNDLYQTSSNRLYYKKKKLNFWKSISYNLFLNKNLNFYFSNFEKKFVTSYLESNKKHLLFKRIQELATKYDRKSFHSINIADILLETRHYMTEANATIYNKAYYNRRFRSIKSKIPEELDEIAIRYDELAEMLTRVILNFKLHTRQFFFYSLINSKLDFNKYLELFENQRFNKLFSNKFILAALNKKLLLPIFKNVSQHGYDLNERYNDALSYLPDYVNFLNNLPQNSKKTFLKNLPDYYKLLFDTLNIFYFDPFLGQNKDWYRLLYNNPYWTKNIYYNIYKKKKWEDLFLKYGLMETLFFILNYTISIEDILNANSDLYIELLGEFTKGSLKSLEYSEFEITRKLTADTDRFQFSFFDYFFPKSATTNSARAFRLSSMSNFARKVRFRRDFFIVPLDYEFKLKGRVEDTVTRKKINKSSVLQAFNVLIRSNQNLYNEHYENLLNQIKSYLSTELAINPTKSYNSHLFYNRNEIKNNLFFKPSFRQFNRESYKIYANNPFIDLASQYIENRYNSSDRLFSTPTNYPLGERFDKHMTGYTALEMDVDDLWYDTLEQLTPEESRNMFPGVRIWPMLFRSALGLPQGTPPLVAYDIYNPYPILTNYVLKNQKFIYPSRFRDPVDDEDELELVQIVAEEGTVATNYLAPAYTFIVDCSVKLFTSIVKFFSMIRLIHFSRSMKGSGDFTMRPSFFQNSPLSTPSVSEMRNYSFKYLTKQSQFSNSREFKSLVSVIEDFFDVNIFESNNIVLLKFISKIDTIWAKFYYVYYKKLSILTNSYILNNNFIFVTFISFIIVVHYLFWYPFMYLHNILREWLSYPKERVDDPMHPDELEIDRHRKLKKRGYYIDNFMANNTGHYYYPDDLGLNLTDAALALYLDNEFAFDSLVDNSVFQYAKPDELIFYSSNLISLLTNELISLHNIQLPGYKFTYNLLDIINITEFMFRFESCQTSLPFYKPIFAEFLHILIGSEYNNFDYHLHYYTLRNPTIGRLTDKRTSLFRKAFETGNILEDFVINNEDFKQELTEDLLNNTYSTTEYTRNTLGDNIARQDFLRINNPLLTIWFSNKGLFTLLNLLNFSSSILMSNDLFSNLLYSEKNKFSLFFNSNLLLLLSNHNSWFFLSKNNLINLQYKNGEKFLPIYLRFNRSIKNFHSLESQSSQLYNLINLYSKQWKLSTDVSVKLNSIIPEDLLFVYPLNHEGVFSHDLLISTLFNLKTYFTDLVIKESLEKYDEIAVDFHNLELNIFYSSGMVNYFKSFSVFVDDWVQTLEESKDWLIYIYDDRLIELNPYKAKPMRYLHKNRRLIKRYYRYRYQRKIIRKMFRIFRPHNKKEFSTYYITPDNAGRYYEEPVFPDDNFRFSPLFFNISSNIYHYPNIYNRLFNNSQISSLNNDLFCQAMSLQYISDDVYYDIYLILTPEGRAINTQLALQSSLQIYSYFNYHLILKHHTYIFKHSSTLNNFILNEKITNKKSILKKSSFFVKIINFFFFIIFLLCLFLI